MPELSPPSLPPVCPSRSDRRVHLPTGHTLTPAAACSTRASAMRRSSVIEQWLPRPMRGQLRVRRVRRPSCSAPARRLMARPILPGSVRLGRFSWARAVRSGADFRAQRGKCSATTAPANRPNVARSERLVELRMSVQLQDQIVDLRADAQDHLAEDMQERKMIRIDRTVADRASRERNDPAWSGSTLSLTANRPGSAGASPGRWQHRAGLAICPWLCAHTIESTWAFTMVPGLVMIVNSASLPG